MENYRFELGKRYRVKFNDERVIEVLFTGGEVPRFEVAKPEKNILEGKDWLKGNISIDEVEETSEKEGGQR